MLPSPDMTVTIAEKGGSACRFCGMRKGVPTCGSGLLRVSSNVGSSEGHDEDKASGERRLERVCERKARSRWSRIRTHHQVNTRQQTLRVCEWQLPQQRRADEGDGDGAQGKVRSESCGSRGDVTEEDLRD